MPKRGPTLSGSIVVAFLLVGSRWGSHLGAAPLYLTDALVGAALLHWAYNGQLGPRQPTTGIARRSRPGAALTLFFGWAAVRAAVGHRLDTVALRDLAPYLYAGVALLSAHSYARSTPRTRDRTTRFLYWALVLHAAWVAGAAHQLLPTLPAVDGIELLSLRPDFDGAMVGVLAAWIVWRYLLGRARRQDLLPGVLVVAAFTGLSSRAALLGSSIALVIAVASGLYASRNRRRIANAALVILFGAVVLLVLPATQSGSRLLASIDPSAATSEQTIGARGTQQARARAWGTLTDWITASPTRALVGVGFGPNFLHESRADVELLGSAEHEDVRSPHNFLLGTWARLGLVGLALWLLLVAALAQAARRARPLFRTEPLLFLSTAIAAALVPAGLLGVVFESPFGALPFYWCAGILLSKPQRRQVREATPTLTTVTS